MSRLDFFDIGRQDYPAAGRRKHVPSTVQPDTLFHFVSKFEYLRDILKRREISPRYCKESFRYLKLGTVKDLAFPMSCFCDIGLQKLESHMECYGAFGVAFPKAWCIEHDFQPVHYLNERAPLAADVRRAFKASQKTLDRNALGEEEILTNYLLHQLMYFKPYQGMMEYRVDGRKHRKCFTDECEWRYVPDLREEELPMVIADDWKINTYLHEFNKVLGSCSSASIKFNYDDLKYVMIDNISTFADLLSEIDKWCQGGEISESDANKLLSKVLVWDEIKGDF